MSSCASGIVFKRRGDDGARVERDRRRLDPCVVSLVGLSSGMVVVHGLYWIELVSVGVYQLVSDDDNVAQVRVKINFRGVKAMDAYGVDGNNALAKGFVCVTMNFLPWGGRVVQLFDTQFPQHISIITY